MKKYLSLLGILVIVTLLVACNNEEPSPNESTTEAPREIGEFSPITTREFNVAEGEHGYVGVYVLEQMQDRFPYRLAFSDRELETAEWIEETLLQMGFEAEQIQVQSFDVDTPTTSWWGRPGWMMEMFESAGYYDGLEIINTSQNIILTIPGRSEETIIIGAHYDSVGNPGISDNASGMALLLESAYRMQDVDHYYTLQFVFFGAEEVGLVGSFYFADNLSQGEVDNLILMINADVIMDGPNLIYAVGYIEGAAPETIWERPETRTNDLTRQIDEIADATNTDYDTELIAKPHAINLPSDHLAFLQFEVPVLVFYATHPVPYPEVFDGDVLHTPDDDLDFIMMNFPGRAERALGSFGRFLEVILSSEF